MNEIPKIISVTPKEKRLLIVRFDNGVEKEYDCSQLIDRQEFYPLRNNYFFCTVKVDAGGYGISWSEDIDLSEYELWVNGKEIQKVS